jgi:hypothetical protein
VNYSYNPWEVLGLKPGASAHDIRVRYHNLLKEVHPDMSIQGGDIARLNQINKAYEIITRSPTLDKGYRRLVSDTQRFYYRYLPEWISRNLDETPRYWCWARWKLAGWYWYAVLGFIMFMIGKTWVHFPLEIYLFFGTVAVDFLLHTMMAPMLATMLLMKVLTAPGEETMAWLMSPKSFLQRELGY